MHLRLTILSVLAAWIFLIVLTAGLLLILQPLERIRRSLEKITAGVRAIEQETLPLGRRADALAASLDKAGSALGGAAQRLADVGRDLDGLAPTLRSRL